MSDPFLISDESGKRGGADWKRGGRGHGVRAGRTVWSLLGWVGFAVGVVGLVDIALTWYPFQFGNLEWEFGTVTQSLNALPTVTVGFGLLLGSSMALARKKTARVLAIGLVLLALWVVAGAVMYATTVPVALDSVPPNEISTGLKKAIARTAAQSAIYPIVFLVLAVKGWRAVGRQESFDRD